jgi:POT family proton-dependent oligopeptide transporter
MFKNHPGGLKVLFFTEIWERFGFYILMAILVLYLDQEFTWGDSAKGNIYGAFLGIVYFLPILGGWLGDRLLGPRRTIQIGALSMFFGYIALACSSAGRIWLLFVGLLLIAFGTGIFKVNMSVSVGNLYRNDEKLKDAGFNLYYMGVNIGATVAPLVATLISSLFGSYRLSFVAAAAGLVISLATFRQGKEQIPDLLSEKIKPVEKARNDNKEERQRMTTLATLFTIVIFFWIGYYQNGFTLTLFAQRSTVVSQILRPETYQFFGPFFILILTPPLLALFARLRRSQREPAIPVKIMAGMIIAGFSMVIMVFAALAGGNLDQNIMSPWWLISSYFMVTIGEILVSPMGQSYVTRVAPARYQGLMMGFWFSATAIGGYLSGLFGRFYETYAHHHYFLFLAILFFIAAFLVLVSLKRLKRYSIPG